MKAPKKATKMPMGNKDYLKHRKVNPLLANDDEDREGGSKGRREEVELTPEATKKADEATRRVADALILGLLKDQKVPAGGVEGHGDKKTKKDQASASGKKNLEAAKAKKKNHQESGMLRKAEVKKISAQLPTANFLKMLPVMEPSPPFQMGPRGLNFSYFLSLSLSLPPMSLA